MRVREELLNMKKEVKEMKQQSMAMEMLSDYKKQNFKLFIASLLLLIMWFITMLYLIIVLTNDNKKISSSDAMAYTQIHDIENSSIQL